MRIDKVTDGRHAEVELTKDWKIDAERRNLTIKSMFLDFDKMVIDFFDGHTDLQNKRVAFVGIADKRIKEEYLQILQYFRFFGCICTENDTHEGNNLVAIGDNADGLACISGERIWTEWKKILTEQMGGPMTLKMIKLSLSPHIGLPDKANIQRFDVFWSTKRNTVHPIILLTQLLETEQEMAQLNLHLKISAPHDLKHCTGKEHKLCRKTNHILFGNGHTADSL